MSGHKWEDMTVVVINHNPHLTDAERKSKKKKQESSGCTDSYHSDMMALKNKLASLKWTSDSLTSHDTPVVILPTLSTVPYAFLVYFTISYLFISYF